MKKRFVPIIVALSCLSLNAIAQAEASSAKTASQAQEESYPLRYIDRPSVMPIGTAELAANASLKKLETFGVDAGINFGIVNEFQGSVSYDGLKINDPKGRIFERTVNLGLKFHYLSLPHISSSISASLPIHFFDEEIVQSIKFGVPFVFYTKSMAGGILADVFELKMRPNIEVHTKFKVWYGVQLTDHFWVALDTTLGELDVTTPGQEAQVEWTAFWKKLPLDLSTTYAFSNAFDVSVKVGTENVAKASDALIFGVGVAYRVGRLF